MNEILSRFQGADYYFNDALYQTEVESKGCLLNVDIEFSNQLLYEISFYDKERFYQELEAELEDSVLFYEENIIFLKKVNKENIINAIKYFDKEKMYLRLIPKTR